MIGIPVMPHELTSIYRLLVINIKGFNLNLQVVFGTNCGSWYDVAKISIIICSKPT